MARQQKVTHDQANRATRAAQTGEKLDRMPLAGFPRDGLPYSYSSNKQSVLAELIALWNGFFKRGNPS